ncbi:His/Gly/Thr/Pro-type tRNA ligase C-terminal domain-containing protein, partial [Novosphingobium sp.]
YAHTTSWGVSTRLIGGLIMTHGDDDGLRVPPAVAPHQVVILPMLRDTPDDEALLAYCEELRKVLAGMSVLGEPVRVLLDKRPGKATQKRWAWVKKGVPLILEIGGRDAAADQISMLRRDKLWNEAAKANFQAMPQVEFLTRAAAELQELQDALYVEAKARRDAHIAQVSSFDELAAFFAEDKRYPGWAEVEWSRPTGAELEEVVQKLKAIKLTMRNTPLHAAPAAGKCIFTGRLAVERIYVARAY